MKFRGTWFLVVLAVALGAWIYFVEYKKANKDEEAKKQSEKVLGVEKDKIKSFEIKNANGDFVVVKDDKTWKLEKPIKDLADESMVNGILDNVTSEIYNEDIEGEDVKQYGLDNPKSSISVTLQDGTTKKVNVGSDAPLAGKVYLQREGDKKVLYAISTFKTQLDRTLRDLRDKRVWHRGKEDVAGILAKYDTKDNHSTVSLVKKNGDWLVDGKDKADPDAVKQFIDTVENLRATDFVSEKGDEAAEKHKYMLDKPEVSIHFEDRDSKPAGDVVISPKKDNNVYMKSGDGAVIYQGFAGAVETLLHKPEDFRDKKEPFAVKKDDVADILLKTGKTEVRLVKKDNNWQMGVPDPKKEVNQIQIVNFLDKIDALRIGEFLKAGEKPTGLSPAKNELVLKDAKGGTLLTVTWGDTTKSKRAFYTKTDKVPFVFGTDTTALNGLTGQPLVQDKAPSPAPGASPGAGRVTETGQPGNFPKPPPAKDGAPGAEPGGSK